MMNIYNPILQPMLDLSFDIETLDNKISSAPIAIGVQQFCRDTGQMGESFYVEIDIDDAMKYGTVSASTLHWWINQEADARKVFDPAAKKSLLVNAFIQLNSWVHTIGEGQGIGTGFNYWGNDPKFDLGILEHAQSKMLGDLILPWCHGRNFRNVRCMRTLMDAADLDPSLVGSDPQDVAHNALSDARWQARAISMAWQRVTKAK